MFKHRELFCIFATHRGDKIRERYFNNVSTIFQQYFINISTIFECLLNEFFERVFKDFLMIFGMILNYM